MPLKSKENKESVKRYSDKALVLLEKTKFKDGLRVHHQGTLQPNEYDFSDLTTEEAEFAVYWEYRREVENFYRGHSQISMEWDKYFYRGGDGSPTGFHWTLNASLFPLPFNQLKKVSILKWHNPELLAMANPKPFREMDLWEMRQYLDLEPSALVPRHIRQIGTSHFSKALKNFHPAADSFMSYHVIALNWSCGIKNIQQELLKWSADMAKEMSAKYPRKNMPSKNNLLLAQLGAWRATRAGLSGLQYKELRAGHWGISAASKREWKMLGQPSYDDPSSFRNALQTAGRVLQKLKKSSDKW